MAQQFLELDPIKFKSRPEEGKKRIYLDENTGNLVLVDSDLNETPVGGNNITTVAVATAIAGNPSVSRAAILGTMGGEVNDPDRIGAEYMPEVFEINYFTTADLDGSIIPPNSYGQKSGTPFFGNASLYSQLRKAAFGDSITTLPLTDSSLDYFLLASFDISAEDMVDAKNFEINFSVFNNRGGGSIYDTYIGCRFGVGAPTLAAGTWLDITPLGEITRFSGRGRVVFSESGGNLRPSLSFGNGVRAEFAANASTDATVYPFAAASLTSPAVYSAPEGVANTLSFYILQDVDTADFTPQTFAAHIDMLAANIVGGTFTTP